MPSSCDIKTCKACAREMKPIPGSTWHRPELATTKVIMGYYCEPCNIYERVNENERRPITESDSGPL